MTRPKTQAGSAGVASQSMKAPGAAAGGQSPFEPTSDGGASSQRIDLDEIVELADNANALFESLREDMLRPHPRKQAPVYNGSQLAQMAGIDPKQVTNFSRRGDLPSGTVDGNRRTFTLAEAHEWVKRIGKFAPRPPGVPGTVIACVNFKGGSTKTSTAMGLAQGLTHRGRKVLVVDLDPQASASILTGLLPAAEVTEMETAAPITYVLEDDHPKDLRYAVRQTYWDGMDIVPSSPSLFQAEIMLPLLSRDPAIHWWALLDRALEPLRTEYDVIVIDTAPSLSYLAINAVMAADALVMPIPPQNLDLSSSVAFWSLLTETMTGLRQLRNVEKTFSFIRVLISRIESSAPSDVLVRDWIMGLYGRYVMPVEIPRSPVNAVGATTFNTVFDITKYDGDQRTYTKLRSAWDAVIEHMDGQICRVWRQRELELKQGSPGKPSTNPASV